MRLATAGRWLFVGLLVVASLGPVVGPTTAGDQGRTPPAAFDGLADRLGIQSPDAPSPVRERVLVDVRLAQGVRVPPDALEVEQVYSRRGARYLRGYVSLSEVRDLSHDPRIAAVRIDQRRTGLDVSTRTASGVAAVGADRLHARGLTGTNVTVGIIDRGFRPSDPEIAGSVGAYRAFDRDTEWVHGTAVASVVADTAPDARLHLAAVGPTTTPEEYAAAVDWLRASGADVILDAGSYFGQPGDGSGRIAHIAENASDDVVFVTSAGNYARRHWRGSDDGGTQEWVTFGDEEGNALNGGAPISGEVHLALRWDEWPTAADYDLYLMRVQAGSDVAVARSAVRQNGDDDPIERISASVPRGRYYVAVRAHNVSGTHDLHLFANHRLGEAVANRSVTVPGTAASVLTVGATEDGRVANFSSRGPVGNRTGVDLVAPDAVAATRVDDGEGTSYAAPYVAGTAALLVAEYPSLDPVQVRAVLRASARDVGTPGPDPAAGYGLLDAVAAADLATERVRYGGIDDGDT